MKNFYKKDKENKKTLSSFIKDSVLRNTSVNTLKMIYFSEPI